MGAVIEGLQSLKIEKSSTQRIRKSAFSIGKPTNFILSMFKSGENAGKAAYAIQVETSRAIFLYMLNKHFNHERKQMVMQNGFGGMNFVFNVL